MPKRPELVVSLSALSAIKVEPSSSLISNKRRVTNAQVVIKHSSSRCPKRSREPEKRPISSISCLKTHFDFFYKLFSQFDISPSFLLAFS
jgi:hypothetical protein